MYSEFLGSGLNARTQRRRGAEGGMEMKLKTYVFSNTAGSGVPALPWGRTELRRSQTAATWATERRGGNENMRVTHDMRVNSRVEAVKIGAVQETPWPFGLAGQRERSFLVLASFQLSHRSLGTCSFAKASPEPKNPRSERPRYFLKRSRHNLALRGLKSPLSTRLSRLVTRLNPLKQSQVVDFPDIEENNGAEGMKISATVEATWP